MPPYFDLGILAVVLVSAVLSMLRGFSREALAIASWATAAVAAFYFHPYALPYLKPYIQKDTIALAVAIGGIFLGSLILISLITIKISDAILDSKVGALDRSLGFLFGAARGVLLAVVAFLVFSWLVPEKAQPEWVRSAKTKPFLETMGEQLRAMLPDDPDNAFLKSLRKPKGGSDEPAAEGDAPAGAPPSNTAPIIPVPPPAKKL